MFIILHFRQSSYTAPSTQLGALQEYHQDIFTVSSWLQLDITHRLFFNLRFCKWVWLKKWRKNIVNVPKLKKECIFLIIVEIGTGNSQFNRFLHLELPNNIEFLIYCLLLGQARPKTVIPLWSLFGTYFGTFLKL